MSVMAWLSCVDSNCPSLLKTREWEDLMVERDDDFVEVESYCQPLEEDELPSTGTVEDVQEASDDEEGDSEEEGACGVDA